MVIVGTVIDEAMGDQLRVTMIATGLGGVEQAVKRPPKLEVFETASGAHGHRRHRHDACETIDYDELDQPAVMRQAGAQPAVVASAGVRRRRTSRRSCASRRTDGGRARGADAQSRRSSPERLRRLATMRRLTPLSRREQPCSSSARSRTPISTTGVGLHTGARSSSTLRPARRDTGIVFHRIDLPQPVAIPAHARERRRHAPVVDAARSDGASVSTVEHLMSALAGLGIDNLHVDVAGPGAADHGRQRRPVRVPAAVGGHRRAGGAPSATCASTRRSRCSDGDKWARFEPFDGFKLDFTIDFPHPVFGSENRHVVVDFAEHSYVEGSRARAHVRLHAGRRGDARRRAWPRRQPAERHRARRDSGCSTARACATTTSS